MNKGYTKEGLESVIKSIEGSIEWLNERLLTCAPHELEDLTAIRNNEQKNRQHYKKLLEYLVNEELSANRATKE